MVSNKFELAEASNQPANEARQNDWQAREAAAANAPQGNTSDSSDNGTIFNVVKVFPTSFAALSRPLSDSAATGANAASAADNFRTLGATGKVLGGLGVTYGLEYGVDKLLFKNQPIGAGAMLGDLLAPVVIMGARQAMPMEYRLGGVLLSHVLGKLVDKYD